ncbi:hypothetical protein TSUD_104090 [Trifolium subterraneum]|uniref:Uncharacterized protein n=1 Tax=Trifolium subterraneum TaxID=3900 RepID=A0A2Z6MTS7_TRISU|nr:hypothetical protein TSUD_104090 [Trifolium subterraneum]
MLMAEINKNSHQGTYDFFCLPIRINSEKVALLSYGKIQGMDALVEAHQQNPNSIPGTYSKQLLEHAYSGIRQPKQLKNRKVGSTSSSNRKYARSVTKHSKIVVRLVTVRTSVEPEPVTGAGASMSGGDCCDEDIVICDENG